MNDKRHLRCAVKHELLSDKPHLCQKWYLHRGRVQHTRRIHRHPIARCSMRDNGVKLELLVLFGRGTEQKYCKKKKKKSTRLPRATWPSSNWVTATLASPASARTPLTHSPTRTKNQPIPARHQLGRPVLPSRTHGSPEKQKRRSWKIKWAREESDFFFFLNIYLFFFFFFFGRRPFSAHMDDIGQCVANVHGACCAINHWGWCLNNCFASDLIWRSMWATAAHLHKVWKRILKMIVAQSKKQNKKQLEQKQKIQNKTNKKKPQRWANAQFGSVDQFADADLDLQAVCPFSLSSRFRLQE